MTPPLVAAAMSERRIEVRHVVNVLTFAIDESTEIAVGKTFSAIDRDRIVIAGLPQHISEAGRFDRVDQLSDLFEGYSGWTAE